LELPHHWADEVVAFLKHELTFAIYHVVSSGVFLRPSHTTNKTKAMIIRHIKNTMGVMSRDVLWSLVCVSPSQSCPVVLVAELHNTPWFNVCTLDEVLSSET